MKEYLLKSKNKLTFATYFWGYLMNYFVMKLKSYQELIISRLDGKAVGLTSTKKIILDNLHSDHEEAGSCMFVYAAHISTCTNINQLII